MVKIIQPLLSEKEETALGRVLEYLTDEAKEYATLSPDQRKSHIFSAVLTLRAIPFVSRPLFELGKRLSTPGADKAIENANEYPGMFYSRHEYGDWGDVGQEDWQRNDESLSDGTRLFSVYRTRLGESIWVITEADRSVTTILLPIEY